MPKLAPFVCARCLAEYDERTEFCTSCFTSGVIMQNHRRPAAALVPSPAGISARDLARSDQAVFALKHYPALSLAFNTFVVLVGGPGQGKTTMALRLAESLQPCAFLALEEGAGPTMAAKLRRLEVRSPNIIIEEPRGVDAVFEIAAREGLRSLVVDSGTVCSLLPSDWLAVARSRGIVVVATLQVRKDGLHAGSNRWLHDADLVLAVEAFHWTLTKSRFQESGIAGEVLE